MHNRCLVVLIDRQHGRIFHFDPEQKELELIEEVFDVVPKAVKGASWKGLADDKVSRHVDEHIHDHYKRVIERLVPYLDNATTVMFVAGQDENTAEFFATLPHQYQEVVAGKLQGDPRETVKKLSARVETAYQDWYHKTIESLLDEIENSRQPEGKGVVGLEPVFEALSLKQVQTLVVNPNHAYGAYLCTDDGFVSGSMATCPACRKQLSFTASAYPQLAELARSQAAEIVAVPDAQLLAAYEGLAAIRRYS